jgi:hypothetical protein
MDSGSVTGFGPTALRGIATLGHVDPAAGDLTLELGISVWLRRSGTPVDIAVGTLLDVRTTILELSVLDAASEPVLFVGRSPQRDVVLLTAYLGDLLARAAAAEGCTRARVVERVIEALPEDRRTAIGA